MGVEDLCSTLMAELKQHKSRTGGDPWAAPAAAAAPATAAQPPATNSRDMAMHELLDGFDEMIDALCGASPSKGEGATGALKGAPVAVVGAQAPAPAADSPQELEGLVRLAMQQLREQKPQPLSDSSAPAPSPASPSATKDTTLAPAPPDSDVLTSLAALGGAMGAPPAPTPATAASAVEVTAFSKNGTARCVDVDVHEDLLACVDALGDAMAGGAVEGGTPATAGARGDAEAMGSLAALVGAMGTPSAAGQRVSAGVGGRGVEVMAFSKNGPAQPVDAELSGGLLACVDALGDAMLGDSVTGTAAELGRDASAGAKPSGVAGMELVGGLAALAEAMGTAPVTMESAPAPARAVGVTAFSKNGTAQCLDVELSGDLLACVDALGDAVAGGAAQRAAEQAPVDVPNAKASGGVPGTGGGGLLGSLSDAMGAAPAAGGNQSQTAGGVEITAFSTAGTARAIDVPADLVACVEALDATVGAAPDAGAPGAAAGTNILSCLNALGGAHTVAHADPPRAGPVHSDPAVDVAPALTVGARDGTARDVDAGADLLDCLDALGDALAAPAPAGASTTSAPCDGDTPAGLVTCLDARGGVLAGSSCSASASRAIGTMHTEGGAPLPQAKATTAAKAKAMPDPKKLMAHLDALEAVLGGRAAGGACASRSPTHEVPVAATAAPAADTDASLDDHCRNLILQMKGHKAATGTDPWPVVDVGGMFPELQARVTHEQNAAASGSGGAREVVVDADAEGMEGLLDALDEMAEGLVAKN